MKFLCVACDEPMALKETRGPDEGSMTLIFGCPRCGHDVAMLTNQMETQMVRSLDVKIGGRRVPAEPMETVRASLAQQRDGLDTPTPAAQPQPAAQPAEKPSGSKCPFTGVVTEAYAEKERATGPVWTAEAQARIERIPPFVRPMVKKGIEDYARAQGHTEITVPIMEQVKGQLGM